MVDYLTARSPDYEPASMRKVASSVRDFLRFAQQRGWISRHLDLAVPRIACGAQNNLPVYLNPQQLNFPEYKLLLHMQQKFVKASRSCSIMAESRK